MGADYYLFQMINGYAGQSQILDKTAILFAKYFVLLLLIFVIIEYKNMKAVFHAVFSSVIVVIVNFLISLIYFRPRPFVTYKVNQLLAHSASASFPSDHAAISFAVAFSIFFYNRKLGITALLIALLISIARVFAGIHYPLDILAGALLGIGSSFLVNHLFKKIKMYKNKK